MVSTRHSGEGTGPPAASTRRHTASTEVAGRVPRELEIDMKDTSRDTKTPESNTAKRTYKHRGYTYEIDENTKPEWIDADPRNRRRLESAETQDTSSRKRRRVDQQTASSPLRPATGKRKRAASTERSTERSKRPVFKQEESQDRQTGTPRKSARQPRVEDRSKPIPWADMITSEIRMKIVKFMALQRQIRKTQQEYDFYCGVAGKVTDGDDFGTGDDKLDSQLIEPDTIEPDTIEPEVSEAHNTGESHETETHDSVEHVYEPEEWYEMEDRAEHGILSNRADQQDAIDKRRRGQHQDVEMISLWPRVRGTPRKPRRRLCTDS